VRKASNLPYDVFLGETREAVVQGDAQSLTQHFSISSGAMYKISINLRKMGVAEEKVLETERLVREEIIAPLQKDLAAEIAALEQKCAGLKPAQSTKPANLSFEIQFPDANDLLDLLLDFNRFLVLLHTLWFARKLSHPDYVRLTEEYRNRIKEGEKRIARIALEALQLARKQKEDAEVEAGVASLAASAAAPEGGAKAAGRRGRKAAESAPGTDKPTEDQEKGPETPPMEGAGASVFSPFEQVQ
jgi:hypothetical protein